MPNITTNLKTWGSTGSEYPDNYNYAEGEQPVDEWDNFFNSEVETAIGELITAVNTDLLAADGSVKLDDDATGITFSDDAGVETLADMSVSGTPTQGTQESYTLDVDGTSVLRVYAEADGSGGIQNQEVRAHAPVDVNSNDLVDGGTVIYDASAGQLTQSSLESDTVTIAGQSVSLGSSTTLGLSNLDDYDLSGSDLVDGAQVIWDQSTEEIPDSAMGSIANSTLANSSVTVAGNSVALGSSTGVALGDLSNVNASGEGSGNNFDADTVDGEHASSFADSSHSHSSGDLTDVSADSVSDAHHTPVAGIPSGAILMNDNDGASLPSGYVLCDGANGTPDLRGRYVKGASGTGDEGTTGGANTVTLTESELASHNHGYQRMGGGSSDTTSSTGAGTNRNPNVTTTNTGGDSAHQNEPAFIELRYMMKT